MQKGAILTPATHQAAKHRSWRVYSKNTSLRRFRHRLALGYQKHLRSLTEQLSRATSPDAEALLQATIAAASEHESELLSFGLEPGDLMPTIRYLAILRVLRDLVTQGWGVRLDDEGIILDPPGSVTSRENDPEREKEALRRSFSFAREAQLTQPPTSRFIRTMERQGIDALFADGTELTNRLAQLPSGDKAIMPQLELIEPGARDPATGILLQDIWRYARHYWSIPYQSTPGRNMFYLVRDTALASRPLIGIAALGNPVLGSSQRDRSFGWSVEGLRELLERLPTYRRKEIAAHLHQAVLEGLEETYSADLLPETWASGWRATVKALEEIEQKSAAQRLEGLTRPSDTRDADYRMIREAHKAVGRGEEDAVDWVAIANTALYRRKRAGTLADLVRAHGTFTELGFSAQGGSIEEAFRSAGGVRAVE